MARVGEAAGEEAVAELVGDRRRDDHRAERHVARLIPFANVRMSGTTSKLSHANHLPVRPKPAITSSQISRIPYLSHVSRIDWR